MNFFYESPRLNEPRSGKSPGPGGRKVVHSKSHLLLTLDSVRVSGGQDGDLMAQLDEALAKIDALPLKTTESMGQG